MSNKDSKKYPLNNSKIININGKRYRSFSTEDQTEKRSEEEKLLTAEPAMKKQKSDDRSVAVVQRQTFFVGSGNMGKIVGTRRSKQKTLERESNCKIIVPPRNSGSHYVDIEGFSEESIEKCKSLIRGLLPEEQAKTHFLSIKIRKCRSIFEKFQDQLLQEFGNVIHPNMFISPYRLHFTLQVLSIRSKEALEHVKKVMSERIQPFIDEEFKNEKSECYIQYSNLGTFPENNPRYARVVHFQPTHTEGIERLIKHINAVFLEEKIIESEQKVSLHSTIMNLKYYRMRNYGRNRKSRIDKIDARDILKKYGDLKGTGFEEKRFQFKTLQLNLLGGGESNKADKYYGNDHKLFFFT